MNQRSQVNSLLPTVEEFRSVLQGYPETKQAFDSLKEDGCDPELICRELILYCGGDPAKLRILRRQAVAEKNWLGNLSNKLLEDATGIERSLPIFSEFGMVLHAPSFQNLPQTLRDYAEWLSIFHTWIKAGTSLRSGRIPHLVYLTMLIENLTGNPHYEELATLIGACRCEYGSGRNVSPTAESVRKTVARFKRDNDTSLLALRAEEEAETLRSKNNQSKKARP